MRRVIAALCMTVVLVAWSGVSGNAAARRGITAKAPPGLTMTSFPQAKSWFKRMCDYLDSLQSFQFHASTVREVIFPKGGRIDQTYDTDVVVQRPNKLRVDFIKPNANRTVYYDGSNLTVYTPKMNLYGMVAVPPTIERMLDTVLDDYGIAFPLADLFRQNAYATAMKNVTMGIVVGPSIIDGVMCKQLAFQGRDFQFQVWVEDSPTPIPRRLVIIDQGVKGDPRFMATISKWSSNPAIDQSMFCFTPPPGAKRIQIIKQPTAGSSKKGYRR